jgi:hypothetical protein
MSTFDPARGFGPTSKAVRQLPLAQTMPESRMKAARWLIAGGWLLAACGALGQPDATARAQATTLRPLSQFSAIPDSKERSLALFAEAGKVIQHPRCLNCHPNGDRPLQGDGMQLHQPLVVRGKDGFGATAMRCFSCHGAQNFNAPKIVSVPGNKNWHLAPIEMAWHGRTLGEICRQLKDRSRNGDKTMAQLIEHMAHDELVGWAWAPGIGRAPAPSTQKAFGNLIEAWAASGAHCPA